MVFRSRKLLVWLISAAAVLVIYLLYNWISETAPIPPSAGRDAGAPAVLSPRGETAGDNKVGMVGGVGIGPVQNAKYTHLNAKKQVDREFGFEKLLHEEGEEWEIEKPYMNIFRRNLKLFMTADEGKVQVEDAVGRATPKDATLTGNVVIHILPEKDSRVKESFIYLDDVIFISEKSQFSSAGPVKFTSQDAQMEGKGLELVYNDELDRLEYLKIIELETLRIRQSSKASLFSSQASSTTPPLGGAGRETTEAEQKTRGGEYYKCVFRKNVVIDGPEQLILADEVSISDILLSGVSHPQADKVSDEKSESGDARGTDKMETTEKAPEGSASPPGEPNKSPEQFADIVVTCDDGIIVVPMDSPGIPENAATEDNTLKSVNDQKGRPTFVAQRIDYSVVTEDIVASGPSELTFYINDITGAEGKPTAPARDGLRHVPVTITAQDKATFLPTSNQVIFEGNVLCDMLRENVNFQQKYTLSAPKLMVDLSKSREASGASHPADLTGDKQSRADIKHLTASGEIVQLDTSKWMGEELLGFTKLKCLQFDYDAAEQMFLAAGPGIIAVDNSKIAEPKNKVGRFSLQRPCYAVVRNFDTLNYLKDADIIIADAGSEQILIDHFPIVHGQYGQQASATANHIEAVLYETSSGQTELSTLSAKGGITYEEQRPKKGKAIQFVGSQMFYDSSKSMITAWGDESQPCFLNGALAPGIEYNLKTDRIKTKIIGPGMLQMGR